MWILPKKKKKHPNITNLTEVISALSRWFSLNMASSVALAAFSLLRISSYSRLFSDWKRASSSSCSLHSFSSRATSSFVGASLLLLPTSPLPVTPVWLSKSFSCSRNVNTWKQITREIKIWVSLEKKRSLHFLGFLLVWKKCACISICADLQHTNMKKIKREKKKLMKLGMSEREKNTHRKRKGEWRREEREETERKGWEENQSGWGNTQRDIGEERDRKRDRDKERDVNTEDLFIFRPW